MFQRSSQVGVGVQSMQVKRETKMQTQSYTAEAGKLVDN